MSRLWSALIAAGATVAALMVASGGWAQAPLVATVAPSGLVQVGAGEVEPVAIELSAHGPNWQHAPQEGATATTSELADGEGRMVEGTLPVPGTAGGTLGYTETVRAEGEALRLGYEVSVAKVMTLSGLQVSIYLPVARYGDSELLITAPDAEAQTVTLPAETTKDQSFQLWYGQGARIEVAKGTEQAFVLELQAATDVVVQDLRQWEQPVYEIRLPAIMDGAGSEVTPLDSFHLELSVTFPTAVELAAR